MNDSITINDAAAGTTNATQIFIDLTAHEVTAITELGFGSPVVGPPPGDATVGEETLRARGLLAPDGELAPILNGCWEVCCRPSYLGEITRRQNGSAWVWMYYLTESGFVEQVISETGCELLISPNELLAARVGINSGLMRDSQEPIDPVDEEPDVGIAFTNLITRREFRIDIRRLGRNDWYTPSGQRAAGDLFTLIGEGIAGVFGPA